MVYAKALPDVNPTRNSKVCAVNVSLCASGVEHQLLSIHLNEAALFLRSREVCLYSDSSIVVRNTIAVRILRLSGYNIYGAI